MGLARSPKGGILQPSGAEQKTDPKDEPSAKPEDPTTPDIEDKRGMPFSTIDEEVFKKLLKRGTDSYTVGQPVEAKNKEGWRNATIAAVNDDGTYNVTFSTGKGNTKFKLNWKLNWIRPLDETARTFELRSRDIKTSNFQRKFETHKWKVSHGTITHSTGKGKPDFTADIEKSFTYVHFRKDKKGNVDTSQVLVAFNNGMAKRYFSVKKKEDKTQLITFLRYVTGPLAEFSEQDHSSKPIPTRIEKINTVLRALSTSSGSMNVNRRRRMAQREFSSRRDSPVMVRLLEEIIAAQDD